MRPLKDLNDLPSDLTPYRGWTPEMEAAFQREILICGYEATLAMVSASPAGGASGVMRLLQEMPADIREAIYQRHARKTASSSAE